MDGLSWGDVYEHIETMCNNDLVQVPCKYAGAVGRQIIGVLDEVTNWLDPTIGSVKESTRDKISEEQLDKKFSEKSLTCEKVGNNVSPVEMLNTATSHDQSCKNELDEKEDTCLNDELNHLDPVHEEYHMRMSSNAIPCRLPSVHQLADEALRSEPVQNSTIEGDVSLPGYKSLSEACAIPSGFDKEDIRDGEKVLDLNAGVGELEDVDLCDSLEDDVDYEEAIISSLKPRKKSYKEKLARRFLSGIKILQNKQKAYKHHKSSANTDNALISEWELL